MLTGGGWFCRHRREQGWRCHDSIRHSGRVSGTVERERRAGQPLRKPTARSPPKDNGVGTRLPRRGGQADWRPCPSTQMSMLERFRRRVPRRPGVLDIADLRSGLNGGDRPSGSTRCRRSSSPRSGGGRVALRCTPGRVRVDCGPDRKGDGDGDQRHRDGQRHDGDFDAVTCPHQRIAGQGLRQAPAPPGNREPLHDTLLGQSRTGVWIDQ